MKQGRMRGLVRMVAITLVLALVMPMFGMVVQARDSHVFTSEQLFFSAEITIRVVHPSLR
jgi:hypothetical protein